MAGKKQQRQEDKGDDGDKRIRTKVEYHFEAVEHEGKFTDAGLVMYYPSEAIRVKEWLNQQLEDGKGDEAIASYRIVTKKTL